MEGLIGDQGFEPHLRLPESRVLPLHQSPVRAESIGGSVRDVCEHMFVTGTRFRIAALREEGLSRRAIASRLGLARPTVDYHLRRLDEAEEGHSVHPSSAADDSSSRVAPNAVDTRARVAALLTTGLSRAEIARRLGIGKGTVSYHARRLGAPVDDRFARRYDWSAIQIYYDAGRSLDECITRFGFSRHAWHEAVKRGVIVSRPAAMPLKELLVAGVYRGRRNLKLRLLREGLKSEVCEECGLSAWRAQPISLALHHENGNRDDNRLSNLRLLCPNCHSQTTTFAGRNGRRNGDASPDSIPRRRF